MAQKKWCVILNVFKVINNMKNPNCKTLKTVADLDSSIEKFNKIHQNRKKFESAENKEDQKKIIVEDPIAEEDEQILDNVGELTKICKLFEFVSLGLDNHIEIIEKIIRDDKKREFSDKSLYYVNKKNWEGVTPIYVACQNGHLKIVELLLKYDADHLILCGSTKELESILEVSIRWGQLKILEFLLCLNWPQEYLKNGLKLATQSKNEYLIKLLKNAITENKSKQKKKISCCFG